jgi:dienelactone hydrolase
MNPKGLVLFSHGSGSGRHSPRNKYFAEALVKDGIAILLVDLLTEEEGQADMRAEKLECKIPGLILNKFNIKLLANRLISITGWICQDTRTQNLIVGYFGASTGSAAAIVAAANLDNALAERDKQQQKLERVDRQAARVAIGAIVSRSGRPDLAGLDYLKHTSVPILLILGANDHSQVISWNKTALKVLGSVKKKLVMVPNASHLFEEPGTLEEAARLASGWFRCYFQIMQHTRVP